MNLLVACPHGEQPGFTAFKCLANGLNILLHFLRGSRAYLLQEGMDSSAIERHQGLNNVVSADHSVVIGSGEFIDGPGPEFIGKRNGGFRCADASFKLFQSWWGQNRGKDRLEVRDSATEHLIQPFSVNPYRLKGGFILGALGWHWLRF